MIRTYQAWVSHGGTLRPRLIVVVEVQPDRWIAAAPAFGRPADVGPPRAEPEAAAVALQEALSRAVLPPLTMEAQA